MGADSNATASPAQPEPELAGQTVVIIGGTSGIGLETARRARAEGAKLILTGRNPDRLQRPPPSSTPSERPRSMPTIQHQ